MGKPKPIISVVVPVYGCQTCLWQLVKELDLTFASLKSSYELILINDCSPDNSWQTILEICQKNNKAKGINLSRNFGQHGAITAGLAHATGEWTVVMDCDLQDKPSEIIKLYDKAQEGYDIVLASRINRQDTFFKKWFSVQFYKILSYFTATKQDATVANFGIYHKKVIKAILNMGDNIRYFPTMVKWVGFNSTKIPVEHNDRYNGETSYNFKKLFNLALDIMFAFSDKPLRLTIKLGLLVSFSGILFAIYNVVLYMKGEIKEPGWATIVISVWFLSGLIIFILGIVGLYIGKTYEKVKNRPVFIINEIVDNQTLTESE